jgi:MtN3 and saliva related transmembrane protein
MTALGYVAGTLTTLSFLPQVVRSARMRSAEGLSWLWLLCFGTGVSAWLAYGVVLHDPAIIAANAATLCAVLVLVWLRARTTSSQDTLDTALPTSLVSDEIEAAA